MGEIPNPVISKNELEMNGDFCTFFNQFISFISNWCLEESLDEFQWFAIRCTKSICIFMNIYQSYKDYNCKL